MRIKTFALAIYTLTVLTVNVNWALLLVLILRFLLFNIRPRKDMKAIFDKSSFSLSCFQHFRKAHKNILIFRITFYSRAKTDYYKLSPIRYFLPQN